MDPVNSAERRAQFLRFALLFVLAMLPVIIIMYLFGRNETQSYNALLKERNDLRQNEKMNTEQGDLVSAVATAATLLQQEVTTVSGDLKEFETSKSGPLKVKVQGLEEAVRKLVDEGGGATSNKALVGVALEFAATSWELIDVYDQGLTSTKELRKEVKKLDKDLEGKVADLEACSKKLENCERTK